jgi:hypothetical protein
VTLPAWKATGSSHETSVPWPTHITGDFALCFVEDDAGTITTPSGWTLLGAYSISGVRLSIFWRFATSSSETNFPITGSANHNFGVILTYTGVNTLNPIHLAGFSSTGSDSNVWFPGLQTFLDDSLIIHALAWSGDDNTGQSSGETNATLGSLTERFDAGTLTGNGGGLAILDGTLVTKGTFDPTQILLAHTYTSVVCTVALQAADKTFGQKSLTINLGQHRMAIPVKQSTAQSFRTFAADSSDGKSGKTGLTLSDTIQKEGDSSFSSISPTITEIGNGHYNHALTTTHMNTVGITSFRATATGADPMDCPNCIDVIAYDKTSATRGTAGTALPAVAAEAAGGLFTRGSGAGQLNQQANGQHDVNVERWLNTAPATPTTAGVPRVDVKAMEANVMTSAATAASFVDEMVDAVFDEATSGHTTAGTFGKLFADIYAAVDTEVAAILAAVDTEIGALQTDITTLLGRLTSTRSGYLDNLSGGAVALASIWTSTIAGRIDAATSTRASQASVDVIDANVDVLVAGMLDSADVTDAVGALILRTGSPDSTLLGHLRRQDALFYGDVTGLDDTTVTAMQPGGVTPEFIRTQDVGAGTGLEVDRTTSES